jgi:hypothetical protein
VVGLVRGGRGATVVVVDPLEGRGGAKTPEQEVADILPLGVDPAVARRVLGEVPFWFHTFALNRAEGIYTPGVAVDHRYRLPFLPASFAALRVLDVGTFDGFYAFVAERRGREAGGGDRQRAARRVGYERAGALRRRAPRASARSHGRSAHTSITAV